MAKAKEEGKEVKDSRLAALRESLRKIIDPEIGMNITDMGMVRGIHPSGDAVTVDFMPTSPFCPVVSFFVNAIRNAALNSGFKDCKVNIMMPELPKFPKVGPKKVR